METTNEFKTIGRLALRVEGTLWNAYYALPDTMERAVFLGSIRMLLVSHNPKRKQAFMDIMQSAVADILEEITGRRPESFSIHDAPEHERGGNA